METSVIEHPALPESATILATAGYVISPQNLGVAATERNKLRERELTRLELRGEIKPATVLNRSPFPLECVNSPWDYIVPARQSGKPYGIKIVASTRTVFRFTGNREMSDHSVRGHHEPKIILPIEQAMEFSFFYNGLSSEDFYSKPGGVIVFEGTMEGITPKSTVRVPRYIFKKGERYLKFEDMLLGDLVKQTDEQMRNRCMAVLEQADVWADDPKTRANIQNNERVWADFAFEQKWIPAARAWRNTQVRPEDSCPRCNAQYVSKTGMCKCSYVVNPLLAYLSGEITVDHVRLNTLSADEWKKVKAEQKRRDEARA